MEDRCVQLVIGSPGAGKSTFCSNIKKIYEFNNQKVIIFTLDTILSKTCGNLYNFDEITNKDEIISETLLGYNGSIVLSLFFFEKNYDLIEKKILFLIYKTNPNVILVDFPGQIETFSCSIWFQKLLKRLKILKYKIIVIHLFDCLYFYDKILNPLLQMTNLLTLYNIDVKYICILSKSFEKKILKENKKKKSLFYWNKFYFDQIKELIYEFSNIKFHQINFECVISVKNFLQQINI